MIEEIASFIKTLVEVMPEMAPKIETAIDKWGAVHNVPTDEYIRIVRDSQESAINARIDAEVVDLDIPE